MKDFCTSLLLFTLLFFQLNGKAQEPNIDSLQNQLTEVFGTKKLNTLNHLSKAYLKTDKKTSFKYSKQAIDLAENILADENGNFSSEVPIFLNTFYLYGINNFNRKSFITAKSSFQEVSRLNNKFGSTLYLEESNRYLDSIQSLIDQGIVKENKFLDRFNNLKIGKLVKDVSLETAIQSEIKLGETKERIGNQEGAINNYKSAVNLLKNQGNTSEINELQLRISGLLSQLDRQKEAQEFLEEAISQTELREENTNQKDSAISSLNEIKLIADSLATARDFESSLFYYQLYSKLSNKLVEDSIRTKIIDDQKKKEILLLRQQKRIADLSIQSSEKEKEREIQLRNTILFISFIILIALGFILYFYFQKRKEHQKLNKTFKELQQAKEKLEKAERKIVSLLKQQVSEDIAEQLLFNKTEQTAEKHFVCILFLDIRNFTVRAESMSPEELIAFQNKAFGFMIDCIERHNGNINQLLGDGFMATFGAPVSHGNDCLNAYEASVSIIKELRDQIDSNLIQPMKIGIGLHAGYVVTGNVGNATRKQYSVTGNPVIIASRIEQLNKQYNSQLIISEAVYDKLNPQHKSKIEPNFKNVILKGRSNETRILVVE